MRVLKKILLWLLLVAVLAALIVGGAVAWFYYNTDPEAFDAPAVTAGGTALAVNGYEWNAPVMGGVLFKSASAPATLETQDLGTWEQASLDITLPADRPTHLVVKEASGNVLLDVNNEAQVTVAFPANGKYTLEADVTVPRHSSADKPGAPAHGYGGRQADACEAVQRPGLGEQQRCQHRAYGDDLMAPLAGQAHPPIRCPASGPCGAPCCDDKARGL